MKRPGVATTISTPLRMSCRCSFMGTPPTTMVVRTARPLVRLKALTCARPGVQGPGMKEGAGGDGDGTVIVQSTSPPAQRWGVGGAAPGAANQIDRW